MILCPRESDKVKVIWRQHITGVEALKNKLSGPKLVDVTVFQTIWKVDSVFWTSLSMVFSIFHRQRETLQLVEMTAEMMGQLIRQLMDIIRAWMVLNLAKMNLNCTQCFVHIGLLVLQHCSAPGPTLLCSNLRVKIKVCECEK